MQRVVPAVVSVHAGGSRGSGFYVKPGVVVTNVHVIEGYSTVDVKAGETSRTARVMSMVEGRGPGGAARCTTPIRISSC